MRDRELLTECLDVLTHDAAQRTFAGGVRMSQLAIKLRAALAAPCPEPTHPGYILGSHWLETAYSRICAGESEAEVLKDCGWERVTDADALRRDADLYRWLRDWLDNNGLLVRAIRGESLAGYEHPDIEALRRDAEKWRKSRAKYTAWQKGGKAEAMEDKT